MPGQLPADHARFRYERRALELRPRGTPRITPSPVGTFRLRASGPAAPEPSAKPRSAAPSAVQGENRCAGVHVEYSESTVDGCLDRTEQLRVGLAHQTAKSSSVHSYRVRDMIATRSPGSMPAAIRPLAVARTSARNSTAVVASLVGSRRHSILSSGPAAKQIRKSSTWSSDSAIRRHRIERRRRTAGRTVHISVTLVHHDSAGHRRRW